MRIRNAISRFQGSHVGPHFLSSAGAPSAAVHAQGQTIKQGESVRDNVLRPVEVDNAYTAAGNGLREEWHKESSLAVIQSTHAAVDQALQDGRSLQYCIVPGRQCAPLGSSAACCEHPPS